MITNPLGRWLLRVVFWLGWVLVLLSTFLTNHFNGHAEGPGFEIHRRS